MDGRFVGDFPRVQLIIPGLEGNLKVEFIVDTGFEGEIALPPSIIRRVDCRFFTERYVLLADRFKRLAGHFLVNVEWMDEVREVKILELDGRPLLGNMLLRGNLVQIELEEGGGVSIKPL